MPPEPPFPAASGPPTGSSASENAGVGADLAVGFARRLRAVGLEVPVSSVTTFAEALAAVGVAERSGVYWAGRATLVRSPEDLERFDAVFDAFWLGRPGEVVEVEEPAPPVHLVMDDPDDEADPDSAGDGDDERDQGPAVAVRYSAAEVLRQKDFARCTDDELDELRRLIAEVRLLPPQRRSRRLRRSSGRGDPLHLRGTVRSALRTGGEPMVLARRRAGRRPRRLLLLLDVSGSMEPYARALLRFSHAAVVAGRQVEVFALGTRLTRLTRALGTHDPDAALAAVARAVPDWSGGTRLGDVVAELVDRWGMAGMARGAVVIVLSDGWDRGDPAVLGEAMERLHRAAHRVVWVNPLKATPGYAPLARGMAAALPHVDEFVEGHSLASLEHLAAVVGRAS